MEKKELTLSNLGGGAAEELFTRELKKVLDNIANPNTEADAARDITLKIKFKPGKDRDTMSIGIVASSGLAPFKGHSTIAFIGKDNTTGRMVVVEHNPRQADFEFGTPPGVTGINQGRKEGTHNA